MAEANLPFSFDSAYLDHQLISTPNPKHTPHLQMSFYNFNLTAEELNSLPKYLHPAHMFAIAELLSVLRRAFEDQDPELHRKGLLSATVSHQQQHFLMLIIPFQVSGVATHGHLA